MSLSELGVREPVTLASGSHSSPDEGVCVMELASLIGGEPFSDSPACVDPVIGSFLRAWNDRAAHAARQGLRPYAHRIVGSRCTRDVTAKRRDLCLEWAGAKLHGKGALRSLAVRFAWRMKIALSCGAGVSIRLTPGSGEYAARLAFARGDAKGSFELLEAMLAVGTPDAPVEPEAVADAPAVRRDLSRSHARGERIRSRRGTGLADRRQRAGRS